MGVATRIPVDSKRLNDARARFPHDRAVLIGNREAQGHGEAIERRTPAHGAVVTRVPRGRVDDPRCAIAAARAAFDNAVSRKTRPTSTLARAGADGSREGPDNFKNREPSSGF